MADKLLQDQHAVIRYAINKVTQLRKPAENSEVRLLSANMLNTCTFLPTKSAHGNATLDSTNEEAREKEVFSSSYAFLEAYA